MAVVKYRGKVNRDQIVKKEKPDNPFQADPSSICGTLIWFCFSVGELDPTPINELLGIVAILGCEKFLEWLQNQQPQYKGDKNPYNDSPDYDTDQTGGNPSFDLYLRDDQSGKNATDAFDVALSDGFEALHLVVPNEEATSRAYQGQLMLVFGVTEGTKQIQRTTARRISIVEPKDYLYPANFTQSTVNSLAAIKNQLKQIFTQPIKCRTKVVRFTPELHKGRTFAFDDFETGEKLIRKVYDAFSKIPSTQISLDRIETDAFSGTDVKLIRAELYPFKNKGDKVEVEWTISF